MNYVFSASRLMKVSEVRKMCENLRNAPSLVLATELKAKEELYSKYLSKNKQLAISGS